MKLKELPSSLFRMIQLKRITASALNSRSATDIPVLVSCTSIPSRLSILHYTVRSVLNQTPAPQKMVLWLNDKNKDIVPKSLKALVGDKFEINFTELDSPHCKLVPSLSKYADQIIVTCDDDLMYGNGWLSSLYDHHLNNPGAIIAHRVRKLEYINDDVAPYADWKYDWQPERYSPRHIPMGYAGVLYPPDSLHTDATNSNLFLKLCPKADDLWFKAMSWLNNRECLVPPDSKSTMYPIPRSQNVSLKLTNVRQDKNREQWRAIEDYYNIKLAEF